MNNEERDKPTAVGQEHGGARPTSSAAANHGYHDNSESLTIEIGPMTVYDVPGVAAVDIACFPTHWSVQSYRNELQNLHAAYFVARDKGQVIGFAGMWIALDEAHITMLAVVGEYRRRGIAKALLVRLLREARRRGCTAATLEVRSRNTAAQALYRSFQFEWTGRREGYYTDTNDDAEILWVRGIDTEAYASTLERLAAETRGVVIRHLTAEERCPSRHGR